MRSRQSPLPRYDVVSVVGEAHDQTFTVECHVELLATHTLGTGSSRRHAEQQAAELALLQLENQKGAKS